MKTKALLLELIEHLHLFEAQEKDESLLTMPHFLSYLNANFREQDGLVSNYMSDNAFYVPPTEAARCNGVISRLLTIVYRYAKLHIKKSLQNSPLQTAEEFSFLIVLMSQGSMSKTELIQQCIIEKTSGIEIIKRLLKKEFVKQYDNQEDKRSQLVDITPLGQKVLFELLPLVEQAAEQIAGNLSEQEKYNLAYILNKLDRHHSEQLKMLR
ncbi:MAG: MarR family transcriptional regulator [Cytophagales bacterium]|nr:MAG: MarR family transcriptional regulator [Cytophagales bacterium]TAF62077.1 MAG: MarR family transcriptional regulator [Cytophagales bacterium]